MPCFDFICNQCNAKFEAFIYKEEAAVCKECGSEDVKKIPGFIGLYEIKGDNNASTPVRGRHRKFDGSS